MDVDLCVYGGEGGGGGRGGMGTLKMVIIIFVPITCQSYECV